MVVEHGGNEWLYTMVVRTMVVQEGGNGGNSNGGRLVW